MARWLWMLSLLVASPVFAHPVGREDSYTVDVEDEQGNSLRTFEHEGQTFVLGNYGERYNIRVRNRSHERIEVVVTVDGRDVISGREGDYVRERGYVLRPHGDVLIEGFRTSEQAVAAFRFTNPGNSYSARMGTPQNVGIIGVAVFREKPPIARYPRPRPQEIVVDNTYDGDFPTGSGVKSLRRMEPSSSAPPSKSAPASAGLAAESRGRAADNETGDGFAQADRLSNLGTEYGESRDSRVTSTRFVRAHATRPSRLITLRYDDENGLIARGIPVHPIERDSYAGPMAFPRNRFAPPPP